MLHTMLSRVMITEIQHMNANNDKNAFRLLTVTIGNTISDHNDNNNNNNDIMISINNDIHMILLSLCFIIRFSIHIRILYIYDIIMMILLI